MNPLSYLYTEFLWRPLFNGLIWFYNIIPGHDLGIAILLFTITIRIILSPLLWKAQRAQKEMQLIQPEIARIQERLKNNKEEQARALMQLYAEHKVNPFSGCLMMLIQLPVLIALFGVFRHSFDALSGQYLYSFVASPGAIHTVSLGIIELTRGSLYLGFLAAITQFIQTKMTLPPQTESSNQFAKMMQTQSLYVLPIIILVSSLSFPAALSLYWTAMNLFGILQEIIMRRFVPAGKKVL